MYLIFIDEDVLADPSIMMMMITYGWAWIPVVSTEQIKDNGNIWQFLAILHVWDLFRLFLWFLQNYGFSVYMFFMNDGWLVVYLLVIL